MLHPQARRAICQPVHDLKRQSVRNVNESPHPEQKSAPRPWQVERFQRSQIQAITILAGGRDGLTRLVRCI